MNIDDPISPDQVEDLVRLYLESTGPDASVDRCRAMIAAHVASEAALEPADLSTARIPTARIVKMPARRTWSALGKYALAASLLIALAVGGYFALAPEAVSAYALVSAATTTLDHPADRCYRVESLIPKAWRKRNPLLDCGDETYLWTRGDRYRFLTLDDGRQRLWGQDAERRLWIVDNARQGLRFASTEIPAPFMRTRAYLSLDLRRLTKKFLDECDLHIQKRAKGVITVRAERKEGQESHTFTSALLEIDAQTKVIRRMELARTLDGSVKGSFTFTLIDDQPIEEAAYTLEGNLDPSAEILDATRQTERAEAWRRLVEQAASP